MKLLPLLTGDYHPSNGDARETAQCFRARAAEEIPINAAYYLTPQPDFEPKGMYDPTYGTRAFGERESRSRFRGPPPDQSRPPSTVIYRRSRSNPVRYRNQSRSPEPGRRHQSAGWGVGVEHRARGYTSGLWADPQYPHSGGIPVRSYSGPTKYPLPLYRKQRYSTVHTLPNPHRASRRSKSADVYPSEPYPIGVFGPHSGGTFMSGYASPTGGGGGLRRYYKYAPTYTTYPPSTVYRQRRDSRTANRYKTLHRAILKVAQIVVGVIVIACICVAARGEELGRFCARTKTQGQIAVVALAAVCLIASLAFILTISFASRSQGWRSADALFSGFATLLYLVCACVESWYASCYPPYGRIYAPREACYLPEWVAAAVFAFINMFLYLADFALALRAAEEFSLI